MKFTLTCHTRLIKQEGAKDDLQKVVNDEDIFELEGLSIFHEFRTENLRARVLV